MERRRILVISGAPGAGKTSLALPLARRLNWPLIAKDHIKETLFDAMGGVAGDLEQSRRFGAGAMQTLWALASRCPEVILEANFRPHSAYELSRLRGLEARVVELYCACPRREAFRRFRARGEAGVHPAHAAWPALTEDEFAEFDGPMGVGATIFVDTTETVDLDEIERQVRRRFA